MRDNFFLFFAYQTKIILTVEKWFIYKKKIISLALECCILKILNQCNGYKAKNV